MLFGILIGMAIGALLVAAWCWFCCCAAGLADTNDPDVRAAILHELYSGAEDTDINAETGGLRG